MKPHKQGGATTSRHGCQCCGTESVTVSSALGLCVDCIRSHPEEALPLVQRAHQQARKPFGLPVAPPRDDLGKRCSLCVNECLIGRGDTGYCGLRVNRDGRWAGANAERGNVNWYHDPLPTNCVADWVCAGGTGSGYPTFTYRDGPEYGYKNLAVFYQACSFDCLFCQNWQYKLAVRQEASTSSSLLADQVDGEMACICYFGGDPSPQLPHALRTSRLALERSRGRILRICWETNGSMHPALLSQAAELSLKSGGCIKFDLKAWTESLHIALCGASNRRTLENFRQLASYTAQRRVPPFLIASTLLIPGYIDAKEVAAIASFIASLDPDIPYSLLAFHPHSPWRTCPPHRGDWPTNVWRQQGEQGSTG
ncbi:MAG: radical SAM protein [Chloroflexota bacterium]